MRGGSRQWYSLDGMFRLQCIDQYEGIPMTREWALYQWRGGSWLRITEGRSRKRVERVAQLRIAEYENDPE